MGVLDSMLGQMQAGDAQPHGGLMDAIGGLLNHPQTGGLSGLVAAFERQGLGGVVASWVGTGQNLPVSAEQLQAVLGSEQLQGIARQLGLNPQEVSGQLAQWLPQVVDRLTPNGSLPDGAAQGGAAAGDMLGGLFDLVKGAAR